MQRCLVRHVAQPVWQLALSWCWQPTLMLTLLARRVAVPQPTAAMQRVSLASSSTRLGEEPGHDGAAAAAAAVRYDMADGLAVAYEPAGVAAACQAYWNASPLPKACTDTSAGYAVLMPPPNVTGVLHLGHALGTAVQDTLVRWRRMHGDEAIFIPGADHAGIATQAVVERSLARAGLPGKRELGRTRFLQHVRGWSDEHAARIEEQIVALGADVDTSRRFFTMDEARSVAVTEAFVRLHQAGLVLRRQRLVHWCPALQSVISDVEVDYIDADTPTQHHVPSRDAPIPVGWIDTFHYPLADGPIAGVAGVDVATTRLETMLGDVAVAVHPDDPRYTALHGAQLRHPFTGATVPIICDSELVDPTLGTGAVKVTPAHDPNDYACGLRHELRMLNILDDDGTLSAHVPSEFRGLDRFTARDRVADALASLGLYRGRRPHPMRLAVCSRTRDVIEPMLKPQWYLRCDGMAKDVLEISIDWPGPGSAPLEIPAAAQGTWRHWLTDTQDWCVSRQLWWGHRIPAWRVVDADDDWIIAHSQQEAEELAAAQGVRIGAQDEDVFDTWFSSALLPLSSLGWPDAQHADLQRFYPLAVMETGSDILFFWVARMAMLCSQLYPGHTLDDTRRTPPFSRVLLHGMVRDAQGRKMSKSLGNQIMPDHLIDGVSLDQMQQELQASALSADEIAGGVRDLARDYPNGIEACGVDGVRFALLDYLSHGSSINLNIDTVVSSRHLANKLWQAVRFVLHRRAADQQQQQHADDLHDADAWLAVAAHDMLLGIERGYQDLVISNVTQASREFLVSRFCDIYLEWTKVSPVSHQPMLEHTMDLLLRALHPVMPYVTEHLWQHIQPRDAGETIRIMPYPTTAQHAVSPEQCAAAARFDALLEVVRYARSVRADAPGTLFTMQLVPSTAIQQLVTSTPGALHALARMARVAEASFADEDIANTDGSRSSVMLDGTRVVLHGQVSEAARQRQQKRRARAEKQLAQLEARCSNPQYASRVPQAVQQQHREQMQQLRRLLETPL